MENIEKKVSMKKIVSIVLNTLFYLFIILLFLFAITNIKGKENNIPNIFGYGYLTVNSNSMKSSDEDSFEQGDIILVKVATEKNIAKLEIGDIITFYDTQLESTFDDMGVNSKDLTKLNTHRIVDITTDDTGALTFITQGDYVKVKAEEGDYEVVGNESVPYSEFIYETGSEQYKYNKIQTFTADKVRGIYIKKLGDGITNTLTFLRSSLGFGLCIVLPTALLLIFEAVILVKNLLKMNQEKMQAQIEKDKEAQAIDLEEQKKKMREELLAELKKEQDANTPDTNKETEDKKE